MRKMHQYVHFQLGFAEFHTVVHEGNFEELVLSNKDDVVVLGCVKFLCGIRWFGRITRRMEAIQKLSAKITAAIRMASTYSHLQEDIARGAPLTFSGSRDPLHGVSTLRNRGDAKHAIRTIQPSRGMATWP